MPYQLQTLVRWLANQRCQCTWDFSGDNLRHVSYLKNCRTLPSDVLSDIQVNWIRGSGVCVLDLIKAVALAVIFGNLQKSVVVKRWKPLRLSLASVLRRRRGCLLPFWRLAFIVCVPPILYTGSISMLMIQIVQKVHFDLLIWPESCPIFCGPWRFARSSFLIAVIRQRRLLCYSCAES